MTALGKILALTGTEQEVHDHLMAQCPWYEQVIRGEDPGDPGTCKHKAVKLTPHTAEASTVDQPTRPPGGPGLFHIKGRHLPPYIQHLYKHLVARYGEKGAYRVAVGVVKKWAAGVNPGGKKPSKTHADVRAAASKNVAEWEKDKADAHHVKASASAGGLKDKVVAEPARALSAASKVTSTAHRLHSVSFNLSHAKTHLDNLKAAKSAKDQAFNAEHLAGHLDNATVHAARLAAHLRDNYPAEARELKALQKAVGLAVSTDPAAKVSTTAHLLESVCHHIAHARRHIDAWQKAPTPASKSFNIDHTENHVDGAIEHAGKLGKHLCDNYPAEGHALAETGRAEQAALQLAAQLVTAPGAKPSAQLRHEPAQNVSASPPLPPGVKLPTPAEVEKLATQVEKDSDDRPVVTGAVKHLRDAAVKLGKNDPIHALASLRSAQTGILSAHREVRSNNIPIANVFSIANASAAARSEMHESLAERMRFRTHYLAVSAFIDRIRRTHFHGMYGGLAQARFSMDTPDPASAAGGKVSHEAVGYRTGTELRRCDGCYMWEAGHCTLVADPVYPDGVCDRFVPIPVEASARPAARLSVD